MGRAQGRPLPATTAHRTGLAPALPRRPRHRRRLPLPARPRACSTPTTPSACSHARTSGSSAPTRSYERSGDVTDVVFPCGWILDDDGDTLRVYYGAADTSVCVATASLSALLDLARAPSVLTSSRRRRGLAQPDYFWPCPSERPTSVGTGPGGSVVGRRPCEAVGETLNELGRKSWARSQWRAAFTTRNSSWPTSRSVSILKAATRVGDSTPRTPIVRRHPRASRVTMASRSQ